jgi:hypothetical protein
VCMSRGEFAMNTFQGIPVPPACVTVQGLRLRQHMLPSLIMRMRIM